ncbi:Di-copper centre-containing protein [Lentithecium fluviatile CBS 122367]|uniref:tyrosinase n=1 Tax=Lentithecium fluviatile CBS 122367 TaxID=1168545 RepID=A0A6G1J6M2_9PLEO|nr:Di-copper centre-containing protein [Lentithecium fluviatile CBS 122367]
MAAFSTPRGALGMLFAVFILLQAVVAFQHHAHSHPAHRSPQAMDAHLKETRALLEERANNVAIKGAADNGQYPRLEIRELQKKADQWNLYLLAMERFKAKPRNDRMSYYQVAGVHGRPFVTWNNQGPVLNQAGYCPHGQVLFGSWHRPYLSVFEQALYMNANEVVGTFPADQQQRWRNALVGLRMPYFDWAMEPPSGQPAVPTSIRDRTVTVTKPSGRVTIPNPLYSYSWGTSMPAEMGSGPSNNFPATLRRPVGTQNNNDQMNTVFGQSRVGWRQRVFALFASKNNWGLVSSAQYGVRTSRRNTDSFESVHDEIHGTAGGNGGHMSYLDVAAFDPIFWLHHTNIDRMLAMHQLLTPNTWVANGNINRNMAQWNAGEPKNANSPLKPFTKNSNGDYFSSQDVRETRTLGYYYPETQARTYQQVVSAINRLYGQGERAITKRSEDSDEDSIYPGRPFKEGDYDTVLSVVGNKFAMPGSYSVHCYLGNKPVSSNSTANSTAPYAPANSTSAAPYPTTNTTTPATNGTSDCGGYGKGYVGSHTFLGGSVAGDSSAPVLVEGSIPLTAALQGAQEKGYLASLHPDHVEPYLAENLSYKVIGPDGSELDPEAIENFHVQVKSCPVAPTKGDDLPSYGDYIELPRAKLPASKPWTYTPGPNDMPEVPEPGMTPVEPSYPNGSTPWAEEGYCVTQQTIVYVDESGKLLYEEKF